MEFNCPTCQTKLRIADDLHNPKVRCRACGTIFRPLEPRDTSEPESTVAPIAPPLNPYTENEPTTNSPFDVQTTGAGNRPGSSTRTEARPIVTTRPTQSTNTGGWGVLFFIAIMLLNGVPRLLRNFNRQPPPAAPIEVEDADEVMRQVHQAMEHARQQEELDRLLEQGGREENDDAPDPPQEEKGNDAKLDDQNP